MIDRAKKIIETLQGAEKAELTLLVNALVKNMADYQSNPTASKKKNWDVAKKALSETLEASSGMTQIDNDNYFATKKAAFEWYRKEGGTFSQSSFYAKVKAEGRKVSRLVVSEQLRSERPQATTDNRAIARDDAETRKAIAAADREEMKRDQEKRELDKTWIKSDEADLQTCAWASLTRDSISGRLIKDIPALIHAAGGHLDRTVDVRDIIDQAITDGCNDIANSGDVDVDVDALEEDD